MKYKRVPERLFDIERTLQVLQNSPAEGLTAYEAQTVYDTCCRINKLVDTLAAAYGRPRYQEDK